MSLDDWSPVADRSLLAGLYRDLFGSPYTTPEPVAEEVRPGVYSHRITFPTWTARCAVEREDGPLPFRVLEMLGSIAAEIMLAMPREDAEWIAAWSARPSDPCGNEPRHVVLTMRPVDGFLLLDLARREAIRESMYRALDAVAPQAGPLREVIDDLSLDVEPFWAPDDLAEGADLGPDDGAGTVVAVTIPPAE